MHTTPLDDRETIGPFSQSDLDRLMGLYVGVLRPAGALVALTAVLVSSPFSEVAYQADFLVMLIGALVLALGYIGVQRLAGSRAAFTASLYVDTLLLGAVALTLDQPELLAIGYMGPIGLAAYFLSTRHTLGVSLLAIALTLFTASAMPVPVAPLVLTVDLIVLSAVGGLLSLLTRQSREASERLSEEHDLDVVALRMSADFRNSLDVEAIPSRITAELGSYAATSLCMLYVAESIGGSPYIYLWSREDQRVVTIAMGEPPAPIQHVIETGQTLESAAVEDIDIEPIAQAVRDAHMQSLYFEPLVFNDDVIGVIGFADQQKTDWSTMNMVRVLTRLRPQLTAALAQSMVFRQQAAALAQMENLAQLREDLIANISHELRTPLTSILGFLQTLQRPELNITEAERIQYLGLVEQGAQRLKMLVDDLLDVNRMQRGVLPLSVEDTSLASIVEMATQEVIVPDDRQLDVHVADPCPIEADPDRMIQVFSNLMVNAIRHGEGRISIRVGCNEGVGMVEVLDEGDGVPSSRVDSLFQPFIHWGGRTDSSGLGLAIAQGIVDAHGGSIAYEQRGDDNENHAFVVRLPLIQGTAE